MELKTRKRGPKVQRGLSVSRELYTRIQEEADKFGLTWNETVELVLERAFLVPANSHNQAASASKSQETVEIQ